MLKKNTLAGLLMFIMVAGCGGGDQDLTATVEMGDPTVVWSSLGMGGIAFSLTNHTDAEITLTDIELLVDERIPEEITGDSLACPGTQVGFGDLYFNISRDSHDHKLKVFSAEGGEAPTTELTIPAGEKLDLNALVFNHLDSAGDGREVDACRLRLRAKLDGASSTSRPIEIHFSARES